ncbi:MAG TPA: NAD(P)H-hydrate dehydratase [Rariglobus sp.]|jgi:NAD(P)H-hydrate epimerase|nr:NAD(P)H-hydrate dehydratase [Rariglobus sp.]
MIFAHPILTCAEAKQFEASFFEGNEEREWTAMQRAGRAVADGVLRDFQELGGFPSAGRVLVLAGKGHNAGDALIAAQHIRELYPQTQIEVRFVLGERELRVLTQRAWRELAPVATTVGEFAEAGYDLVLDGIFGFQFHPPLDNKTAAVLNAVNALPVRLRAAVDLPSGLDEASAFRADFTYATGIVKSPLLTLPNAGRLRYLDLNFKVSCGVPDASQRVLISGVLDPLRALRPSHSDKRTYGHLFIIGGSRHYPGAVLMSVMAALRSGAGLVTAFVPESLAAAFAARVPEAMWVGWPETPDGNLALEGAHLLREKISRATALLVGPGLGREPETLALVRDIVGQSAVPLVVDADALQADIVLSGKAPRILTPHAGEYGRIKDAITADMVFIQKGPITRVRTGSESYWSFFGGPVLARGGSGDVLAGLTGGLLAQTPGDRLLAACRGAVWHGMAADALARAHGQVSVRTTQLIEFLPSALRG